MPTVLVFAKAAVDMFTKEGAYAYTLMDKSTREAYSVSSGFKKPIKTLAQADCAATVNALHKLSTMEAAGVLTELEIVTDSSVVKDLIEVYKFQKHCEDIVGMWRELKTKFPLLTKVTVVKAAKELKAGDNHAFNQYKCKLAADDRLGKIKEHSK